MNRNVTALALTFGLFWSAAIFMVSVANLIWPEYGRAFLDVVASIYPGFHPGSGIGSVMTGAIYGFVDAAIAGVVFGWIYNFLACRHPDKEGPTVSSTVARKRRARRQRGR
jgi:hypothetical protein